MKQADARIVQRREWITAAKQAGVTVVGRNGEQRPGVPRWPNHNSWPVVVVADDFAPIRIEVDWPTVQKIGSGEITAISA